MSEEEFMRRLRAGDEDAWSDAFAVLGQDARRVALTHPRLLLPEDVAETVALATQREIASPSSLQACGDFRDLRAATEVMALRLGLEQTPRRGCGGDEIRVPDGPSFASEVRFARRPRNEAKWVRLFRILREMLEKALSQREQRIVRLFYLDGFDGKAIAREMELPLGIVAAAFGKALGKIKQAIRSAGLEPSHYFE